ncbi:hypothetical protein B0J11DRAFT_534095 [Dendryphion nanum]|uniref:Uncharacterized protein n=1 Tax=Dendryphion nanum TaxID=256645 RepID=A0A9P9DI51_9PLEO|nr:hypothetical protein B0J11DRAFT_534095 [Dendryphion nanum]
MSTPTNVCICAVLAVFVVDCLPLLFARQLPCALLHQAVMAEPTISARYGRRIAVSGNCVKLVESGGNSLSQLYMKLDAKMCSHYVHIL